MCYSGNGNLIHVYNCTWTWTAYLPFIFFYLFPYNSNNLYSADFYLRNRIKEGAFVLLFGMAGVKPEMATAMSFAWFLSTASGGLVGLFEYLRLKS